MPTDFKVENRYEGSKFQKLLRDKTKQHKNIQLEFLTLLRKSKQLRKSKSDLGVKTRGIKLSTICVYILMLKRQER